MNNKTDKIPMSGYPTTAYKLWDSFNVTIPQIQRDYAQGRVDVSSDVKFKTIRSKLLDNLFNAIYSTSSEPLILDYIYGAVNNECYEPIDGQQRLTTLFLLHWYFAVVEKKLKKNHKVLEKFSYKVRDTAREFCEGLVGVENEKLSFDNNKPSEVIVNTSWFHGVYNSDPTVRAMLVMLDAIHEKYQGRGKPSGGFDALLNGAVQLYNMDFTGFTLADDLFIKMNARGKALTNFEKFKADAEKTLNGTFPNNEQEFIDWKEHIDNKWLQAFWKRFTDISDPVSRLESAEGLMFRTILFLLNCESSKHDGLKFAEHIGNDNIQFVNYAALVPQLKKKEVFRFLFFTLDRFEELYNASKDLFLRLEKNKLQSDEKAELYARIRFSYKSNLTSESDCSEVYRIIRNLVNGQRSVYHSQYLFQSTMSVTLGDFLNSIESILEDAKHSIKNAIISAGDDGLKYIEHEKTKMRLADADFTAIKVLEENAAISGLAHNFIFEGKLLLNADEFSELQAADASLILRGIQAFSKQELLLVAQKRGWMIALKSKSGGEELGYSKKQLGFASNDNRFGCYIWTADSSREALQTAVKDFIKAYAADKSLSAEERIKLIIAKELSKDGWDGKVYWLVEKPVFFSAARQHKMVVFFESGSSGDMRVCNGLSKDDGHYALADIDKHSAFRDEDRRTRYIDHK